jgi:diguanylate cyclase (GGDEF)-like protein
MLLFLILIALYLLPVAHPALTSLVGVETSWLWGVHLVPVAILAYRYGFWGALPAVLISVVLVLMGEYVLASTVLPGQGLDTANTLALATSFSDVLVAGLALVGRRIAHKLRDTAFTDPLTGLPNRRLFLDRLSHRIAQAQRRVGSRFGVLFLDLDDFKLINDSLGHAAGNEVLQRIARRLERSIRATDTVTRLGGDEFVILLDEIVDSAGAEVVARRVRTALENPVEVEGQRVQLSTSIGIVVGSEHDTDPEALVGQADTAMYGAKSKGKGGIQVFDSSMHERARTRLALETDLGRALERAEFLLHYQPIISLRDGSVVAMEALVRWRHPKKGVLGPGHFIQVAEDTGLIEQLGNFVLREACQTLTSWRHRYRAASGLSMGVNVSARQLSQNDFVGMVASVLDELDLPPRCLTLEITETALVENAEMASRFLGKLRKVGVDLSIDDFGTGYSSLHYLHQFPVQSLKIDRSFVAALGADPRNSAIIRAVVALAQELRIKTVAEGVEYASQRNVVTKLGCDLAQGYLFFRPLPPQEAEELVARMSAGKVAKAEE